jgi:ribosome maturation factor RimP
MSVAQNLTDIITPVVEQDGFILWDLNVTRAGKRSVVSVTIDKQGGATLDEIAEVSKDIAPLLDESTHLDDAYHLEVASPGLERSLSRPDHYQWSIGSTISVSYRTEKGLERLRGKLTNASNDTITIETENESQTIDLSSITKAHIVFDYASVQGEKK